MSDYKDSYEKHYREKNDNKNEMIQSLLNITIAKEIQNTGSFQLDFFDSVKNEIGNEFYDIYIQWSKFTKKIDKLGLDSNSFLNYLNKV
jgi:hypothetical protein